MHDAEIVVLVPIALRNSVLSRYGGRAGGGGGGQFLK